MGSNSVLHSQSIRAGSLLRMVSVDPFERGDTLTEGQRFLEFCCSSSIFCTSLTQLKIAIVTSVTRFWPSSIYLFPSQAE